MARDRRNVDSGRPTEAVAITEKPTAISASPVAVVDLPDDAGKWAQLTRSKPPIPRRQFRVGTHGGSPKAEIISATDEADATSQFVKKHNLVAHHHRFRALLVE